MKATKLIICLLGLLLAVNPPINAQTKKQKKEETQKVIRELVEAQKIKVEVDIAYPMRGRSRFLTSTYSVEIRNDSVFSYLPYFGIAYSVPYGGGGKGLIFDEKITNYKLTFDKKGTAKIQFKARTDEDSFVYYLSIYSSGDADVYVTPTNRQSISFRGNFIYDKPIHKSEK
jgi:hypothetical protein